MSKRARLAVVAGGGLLAVCFLTAAVFSGQEPRYNGLTMGEWLKRPDCAQTQEALLVLGTNNMPLLTERVAYDAEKDLVHGFLYRLSSLTGSRRWHVTASRRSVLAENAVGVFCRLGPRAAPAIPELARIAKHAAGVPSERAISVLATLGDEGLAVVASEAAHTNPQMRLHAVGLLVWHTESSVARLALTNALTDPDAQVRQLAWACVTNLQVAR